MHAAKVQIIETYNLKSGFVFECCDFCDLKNPQEEMGAVGFEPTKAEPSDLQSDPFVHFGTRPVSPLIAGGRLWSIRRSISTVWLRWMRMA